MHTLHHALLTDLLAMDCHSNGHDSGLDLRLLEALLERHAPQTGNLTICSSIHHDVTAGQGIRHVQR